jgi:cyclophilin family peptidyl-prolyl cis-trans isomerase
MRKSIKVALILLCCNVAVQAQTQYVRFETSKGNITVVLYDQTPKHRDQFLKNIKNGLFENALFNRVIKGFVSQGGELDDVILDREKLHPDLPLQRIPLEVSTTLYHKKGTLGAGRNDNPDKSSYFSQIYFTAGNTQNDAQLDAIELIKHIKYSSKQRKAYKSVGGTPRLDQDYTVFGEIVKGMDVAEHINSVATDKNDLPFSPISFKVVILSKKEITALKSR